MPRWEAGYPVHTTLSLHQGKATYRYKDEEPKHYTTDALRADPLLLNTLIACLDFDSQLEVEATLLEDALPPSERIPLREGISLQGRPSVPRYFSDNMGRGASTYNIWLNGRSLIITVRGQARLECSFQEFLALGFSAESAALIGPKASEILAYVRQLSPLACFCETGAETPSQHGSIRELVSKQHPSAPCDHRVTVGRCTVCGRGWTFTESGDSHYSYNYQVRAFPSD